MNDLYTDGSCLGNPGKGGWAAFLEGKFKISGKDEKTTNNKMEMTAIIKGLEKCLEMNIKEVTVYTDSFYTMNGSNKWIQGWKRNNWKTANGQDVKNKDLWLKIDELTKKFNDIKFEYVQAHAGNRQNEIVDSLARARAKE